MDRPAERSEHTYKFSKVQIFRDQELGHGSYGAVYKSKCDSLPCAAKLIYPVLFASDVPPQTATQQAREHRQPLRRFEAECHFLSQIKHPNIVQYLGVYHDPDTNVPVLLMELMDESLTHFLENANSPILFHIQVNILHDTALALAFLHSNGITHRDMSSNNVLLIAGCRAKVTDFGMSTLADSAGSHLASLTQCPGTPAYMSPEALDEPPVYSEKLDCFSFGVLAIQTITRKFPKPTDRFQTMEVVNPAQPSRMIRAKVPVPELERRQAHISLIPEAHPLRSIALDCIKDRDVERPTAQQLCESLEGLKTTPLFASSVQQIRDRELQLQPQRQTFDSKDEQIHKQQQTIQNQEQRLQEKDRQIKDNERQIQSSEELIDEFQKQTLRQQEQIQEKDRQLEELRKILEQKNQQITQIQGVAQGQTPKGQTPDLQTQLQQLELKQGQQQQQPQVKKKPASRVFTLSWKKGPKAPRAMRRGSSTIIGNIACFNPGGSSDVYAFHCNTTQWSTLPQCPYGNSTLTNINNQLTTLGGFPYTNKLFTLRDLKWVELYPPMNTERQEAAVLSTNTHVIAMGGLSGSHMFTSSTEVLQLSTNQWSETSPLPYGIQLATTTLCGNNIYLTGGDTWDTNKNYSVMYCNITKLFRSTQSSIAKVWHNIPDLPVEHSTCVTVQDQLLAIGGKDKQEKRSNIIYKYDRDTNQWSDKGHMAMARSKCLATVLPNNNLLVVGGFSDGGRATDETEIAMIA